MEYVCGEGAVVIRKLRDSEGDYALMLKWLSDPLVLDFYEGRSNPFDMGMIKAKFAPRARGESRVVQCIIEHDSAAIGFVQYYAIKRGEYCEAELLEMEDFKAPHGIDIVIGETGFWNRGVGTNVVKMLTAHLLESGNADIIFVDPQTRNRRAIRCYEKCGFVSVAVKEKRELHDGEYQDSLIMCKTSADKPPRSKNKAV